VRKISRPRVEDTNLDHAQFSSTSYHPNGPRPAVAPFFVSYMVHIVSITIQTGPRGDK
jgi:hypothetical protein